MRLSRLTYGSCRACSFCTLSWLEGSLHELKITGKDRLRPPAAQRPRRYDKKGTTPRPPAEPTWDKSYLQYILVSRNVVGGRHFFSEGERVNGRPPATYGAGRLGRARCREQIKRCWWRVAVSAINDLLPVDYHHLRSLGALAGLNNHQDI